MIRIGPLALMMLFAGVVWADCDNPSLVVDELAEGVKYRECWQVEYIVPEAYPADNLIRRVTDALVVQGWRKLTFDPTRPAIPKELVHRWLTYEATHGDTTEDRWIGWFIREDESRVQVTFRYFNRDAESSSGESALTTITFISPQQWANRPKGSSGITTP